MAGSSGLRRLKWRIGRRLYMRARGEQRTDAIGENGESTLIARVLARADPDSRFVACDIGANQGEYTATILDAAGAARREPGRLEIHAFEPMPATAAMFRDRMVGQAGSDCVQLHDVGLSDQSGMANMGDYGAGEGTNTLHFAREGRRLVNVAEVRLTTLADFAAARGIGHIHLAKIDTEGNDAAVLRGAAPLLRAGSIDVVQFEYNHRWVFGRAFLKDIFELIAGLPYALVRVDEARLTVFDAWHPELERFFQSNYALVHERAQAWLPLYRGRFDESNTYG